MNGIDKIIDKIKEESLAFEETSLQEAAQQIKEREEKQQKEREALTAKILEKAQRDAEEILLKSESAASLAARNILLQAKSEWIEMAFENAKRIFRSLPPDDLIDFLSDLLCVAVKEQIESEIAHNALYDKDQRSLVEEYQVILSAKDRSVIGEKLVEQAQKQIEKEFPSKKLVLATDTVAMDTGFIVRYGNVETNCSLALLMEQMRETLESSVYHVLF